MTEPHPVKLSVVIPVYNEKNTILTVLEKVNQVSIPKEIIVIDNCSTDGTREILQNARGIDRLLLQTKNMGKGSSIRMAIPHIRGEYMVIQDGDLEYDPQEFHALLGTAEKEHLDAVYGSRIMRGIHTHYNSYYGGVMLLTFLTNILFHGELTDAATTYKLVKTSILRRLDLNCSGFDLDFELTNKLLKAGVKIVEIPISYSPRTFEEGKKIRATDGIKAFYIILRDRFF